HRAVDELDADVVVGSRANANMPPPVPAGFFLRSHPFMLAEARRPRRHRTLFNKAGEDEAPGHPSCMAKRTDFIAAAQGVAAAELDDLLGKPTIEQQVGGPVRVAFLD